MPRTLSRRSALLLAGGAAVGGAGVVAALTATEERHEPGPAQAEDLDDTVRRFVASLSPSMPYRPPEEEERRAAVRALATLGASPSDGGAVRTLADLGFVTFATVDSRRRRVVVTASSSTSDRSWGLVALPVDQDPRLLVEVPHPHFDLDTEKVGLELAASVPGAVLLVAGAHRQADGGRADVAHQVDSLFHAVTGDLAGRYRIPQVQLHGFDDDHAPDTDVIVSPGAGAAGALVERVADGLESRRFALCRAWRDDCRGLEGRTNVQGLLAGQRSLPFLHLEMSADVRGDQALRARVVDEVSRAQA